MIFMTDLQSWSYIIFIIERVKIQSQGAKISKKQVLSIFYRWFVGNVQSVKIVSIRHSLLIVVSCFSLLASPSIRRKYWKHLYHCRVSIIHLKYIR